MARSLRFLKQDRFGPPYFLAYRLHDARRYDVTASLGAIVGNEDADYRLAYAEARYGGRDIDNTDLNYQGAASSAPSDPEVLRQTFWQLTDTVYKGALSGWLEKKAKRATELITDPLDDFTLEASTVAVAVPTSPVYDGRKLRALVLRLSDVFRAYPDIQESNASATVSWARRSTALMTSTPKARLLVGRPSCRADCCASF
ncbi:MAG: hypothetical protein AAB262_06685 [Elusimicrobiota bacterium]